LKGGASKKQREKATHEKNTKSGFLYYANYHIIIAGFQIKILKVDSMPGRADIAEKHQMTAIESARLTKIAG